ncbi:uncharacterized protein LOC117180683 [Belonocnema kinseyi]|uniref:uncharacterized protein LOC117180683 n=1 Tax=Belonocnema kinseyi TaxID=2817044 RepID=UPI00143D1135|nr:uncharacterized protein LOC117180683 [Belonocnema kinseyi]
MDENEYPTIVRRNRGVYNRLDGGTTDNQYALSHNDGLLQLFNCHINVEEASSIKSVKYSYKYIYEGHDAATVVFTENDCDQRVIHHAVIRNFIETRYFSPVEACDRIYGRPLQNKIHSIIRLLVDFYIQQTFTISDEGNEDSIRTALEKLTMLLAYFALNQRDHKARDFTYAEIPSHYVFKKEANVDTSNWVIRKAQFNVIGKMYPTSPNQVELFHLRLLLITVKGASACLALGVIEDDTEWNRAIAEGEVWMMPYQLRHLLVRILIYCHPNNPEVLWNNFKDSMSQNFHRNCTLMEAHQRAYIEINTYLLRERYDLSYLLKMPQINELNITIYDQTNDGDEVSAYQHEEIDKRQYKKLNLRQKDIIDKILNFVMINELMGQVGQGKSSFTLHCIICYK